MLMDLSIWDIGIKILKMEKLYSGMNMDKHFNVFLKMINYKIEFQYLFKIDPLSLRTAFLISSKVKRSKRYCFN
jgi:hypothetical protein